jgi:hypothetical protein
MYFHELGSVALPNQVTHLTQTAPDPRAYADIISLMLVVVSTWSFGNKYCSSIDVRIAMVCVDEMSIHGKA